MPVYVIAFPKNTVRLISVANPFNILPDYNIPHIYH